MARPEAPTSGCPPLQAMPTREHRATRLSATRYNQRCDLVAEEVNAIGTAYLRVNLVGAQAQPALRQHFRDYVDSRIALWRKLADRTASEAELARTAKIQADIWAQAVKASEENQTARMLFLPALNEMFDIVTKRLAIMLAHPPALLYLMLFILAVMCGWLIGYGMSEADHPNWAHELLAELRRSMN